VNLVERVRKAKRSEISIRLRTFYYVLRTLFAMSSQMKLNSSQSLFTNSHNAEVHKSSIHLLTFSSLQQRKKEEEKKLYKSEYNLSRLILVL
jgi:hypothetical protein